LFPSTHNTVSASIPSDGHTLDPSGISRPIFSLSPQIAQDSAKFVNGDHLTGTIEAIEQGKASFSLDLIGEKVEFPLENFSRISFTGPPSSPPERSDTIYLRDGSYLTATVAALSPDVVEGETLSGQEITIPRSRIAGIGFYRPDDVLFENDFSHRGEMGFVPVTGGWKVEKGQLVQASPVPFCRAYVRRLQAGMMRYEWTTDASMSYNTGLLFFASTYNTRFGQSGYMVALRGKDVYFYKIIGERRYHGRKERVKSPGSLVRLRADYDPRSGEIVLWTGNDVLMRLFDSNPIPRGEYVLLHTEGKGAFDDVRISHLVGTIDALTPEEKLDTVLLSNGDRVSGQVVEISEHILLKNPYAPGETPIDRRRVRSIAFAASHQGPPPEATAPPRISLWNGDLIFGTLVSMDDRDLTLKPSFVEHLVIARASLRTITFRHAPPRSLPAGRGAVTSLLTAHMERQTPAASESKRNSQ